MLANHAKRKLQAGQSITGTMCTGLKPTAVLAEMAAAAGFDFLMISMEHSAYSLQDVHDLAQMCRALGITPLARVPDLSYQWVTQVLDIGIQGVMAPRMQSAQQAQELVSYVRYPPHGLRGFGGRGRLEYGLAKVPGAQAALMAELDQETLVIAQIEQTSAINDIDAIAALDGVDICLIGPNDLSIACGCPADYWNPAVVASIEKVVAACRRHGKAAGGHFGKPEDILEWAARGMRVIMCASEIDLLGSAWTGLAKKLRSV